MLGPWRDHGGAEASEPEVAGNEGTAGGGGMYSFVTCLSRLTIDHASLLRRSTVLVEAP